MFKAFPTPATDDWGEDREVPLRELSITEFFDYAIGVKRTEWVDALNESEIDGPH
ncbi:MAG: hypothetical protein WC856_00865 [Methylococcaceae bacterium]